MSGGVAARFGEANVLEPEIGAPRPMFAKLERYPEA